MISFFKSFSGFKIKSELKFGIALGILLLCIFFIRYRLLNVPLERDEGEYAYMGQLILQNIPPYDIAYNMKFPGVYYSYAFFMGIFGESTFGVHMGLMFVNLISIFLIYKIGKRLSSNFAALTAATTYAFLSLDWSVMGFAAHATHFVTLFALLGIYFLIIAEEKKKIQYYFLSGLFFGIAPIMKQTGVLFCFFGALYLVFHFLRDKNYSNKLKTGYKYLAYLVGCSLPFIVLLIIMKATGVFDKFWFWTITYASDYINQVKFSAAISIFIKNSIKVIGGFVLIWLAALSGLYVIYSDKRYNRSTRTLLLLLFIFSFLTICPGFYFRRHYYITLLPIIAILSGITFQFIYSKLKDKYFWIPVSIFVVSILIGVVYEKDYLFSMNQDEISRQVYGYNPFVESLEIAQYIEDHSSVDDKIAILGSEPQICFYSNRKSVTGYIYVYSLMENQKNSLNMQREMISEIESGNPKFILLVNMTDSWIKQKTSNLYIFNWLNKYLNSGKYKLTGIVDVLPENSVFKWDNEAINYYHKSDYYIQILERIY